MILYNDFDDLISKQLRAEEVEGSAKHKPSGKLSASMLGEPVQWQVLKTLGIGTRQIDDYTLRKFEVGRHTEEWFLNRVQEGVLERQKFVEYRGAIGYIDAVVNAQISDMSGQRQVTIPLEVKSTSNAKFKRILKQGADENHKLQAAFYAMALKSPYYGLTYIATDDRRTHTWIFATADMEDQINTIISNYELQMGKGEVPVFEPRYEWQRSLDYNKFPEWMLLNQEEINLAMAIHYPTAWERYQNAQGKTGTPV